MLTMLHKAFKSIKGNSFMLQWWTNHSNMNSFEHLHCGGQIFCIRGSLRLNHIACYGWGTVHESCDFFIKMQLSLYESCRHPSRTCTMLNSKSQNVTSLWGTVTTRSLQAIISMISQQQISAKTKLCRMTYQYQHCKSHDHDHQWADLVMTWLP